MGQCVICEKSTSGSLEFCQRHFHEHKSDIMGKKPWVKALKNQAQRERRMANRESENVSLDEYMDKTYEKKY